MSYMTMEEQIASHYAFLKEQNFAIETLNIDGGFIRCCASNQASGRGELKKWNGGVSNMVPWRRRPGKNP